MLALGIKISGNIKIEVRELKRFLGKTPYTPQYVCLLSKGGRGVSGLHRRAWARAMVSEFQDLHQNTDIWLGDPSSQLNWSLGVLRGSY